MLMKTTTTILAIAAIIAAFGMLGIATGRHDQHMQHQGKMVFSMDVHHIQVSVVHHPVLRVSLIAAASATTPDDNLH
jgi:hypothetical protein